MFFDQPEKLDTEDDQGNPYREQPRQAAHRQVLRARARCRAAGCDPRHLHASVQAPRHALQLPRGHGAVLGGRREAHLSALRNAVLRLRGGQAGERPGHLGPDSSERLCSDGVGFIAVFVETLDKIFENVCELDLIFHSDKVHYALDEIVMGGMVLETNINEVLTAVNEMNRMDSISSRRSLQSTIKK
ncbi:AP-3 complex subunit sigma [Phytophthora cactorum]|nr:AP-3 complex subunit sigma [Phytophthora cactorum]